jgi:hypothetical protein
MKTADYLDSGIKQGLSRFRLAVYLWLIILIFSFIAVFPLTSVIRINLGHFYLSRPALMPFELHLAEVFMANRNIFQPYFSLLLIIILLLGLFSVFLNAGVFGRMVKPEKKIGFMDFLDDGCRHFCQFFLAVLISLPFFLLLLLVYRVLVWPLNAWTSNTSSQWPVIIGSNLRMLVFILLWTVFKLLFDLVRIIIVSESKKVIPALHTALNFLKKQFFKLWGLFLMIGFCFAIISLAFLLLGRLFSTGSLAGILIIIVLGQAYIFFRLLTRLVFIGVETSYYFENR